MQIVFLAGIYILFIICGYYSGFLTTPSYRITLTNLFIPIPELFVVSILIYLAQRKKGLIKFIGCCFGTILLIVFLVQCAFLDLTGEFISTLALANIGQEYLIFNYMHVLMIVFIVLICLLFIHLMCRQKYFLDISTSLKTSLLILFFVNLFLIAWQNGFYTNGTHLNKYLVGQTPVIGLIKNIASVYKVGNAHFANNYSNEFPFLKSWVYKADLAFPAKRIVKHPNVIIILTEGTSARL